MEYYFYSFLRPSFTLCNFLIQKSSVLAGHGPVHGEMGGSLEIQL